MKPNGVQGDVQKKGEGKRWRKTVKPLDDNQGSKLAPHTTAMNTRWHPRGGKQKRFPKDPKKDRKNPLTKRKTTSYE